MRQDLRPDTDEIGDLILTRLRLDDGVLRGSTGELVLCDGLPCTSVSLRPCTEMYSVFNHFHRRYGETQAANRPSFAYYNADNCLTNLC